MLTLGKTLFDNPEVTAMAEICDILQHLEDDAARMRVMHWAFGRFSPAFKRQGASAEPPQVRTVPAPVQAAPPEADFGNQISELQDLFV